MSRPSLTPTASPTTTTKDSTMTTATTTTREATITRREATLTEGLQQATLALRRLAGTDTPLSVARATTDRYARAIGATPGAGGDAVLTMLLSADAARWLIEDIDHRLMLAPGRA